MVDCQIRGRCPDQGMDGDDRGVLCCTQRMQRHHRRRLCRKERHPPLAGRTMGRPGMDRRSASRAGRVRLLRTTRHLLHERQRLRGRRRRQGQGRLCAGRVRLEGWGLVAAVDRGTDAARRRLPLFLGWPGGRLLRFGEQLHRRRRRLGSGRGNLQRDGREARVAGAERDDRRPGASQAVWSDGRRDR